MIPIGSSALGFGLVNIPVNTNRKEQEDRVGAGAPEPLYPGTPYYQLPHRTEKDPYAWLRKALLKFGKPGIDRFVLHHEGHLADFPAYRKAMILNRILPDQEIRSEKSLTCRERQDSASRWKRGPFPGRSIPGAFIILEY